MGSLERPDNVIKSEYASRAAGEFHRHGRAGIADEESSPKGDLSRLRQLLGPEPEVVHVPQPTRRVGWFVTGFTIALVLGIVIALVAIVEFPALFGKGPGANTKTAELVNPPAAGIAVAPAAPQPASPATSAPVAPTAAQPANNAPGRVATAGGATEPAPAVRGVTDTEIRFGMSAPFSGPAKELGQNMMLGIEAAFKVANAKGGVFGRQLRLIAADDGYEPARTAGTMTKLYEKDQVFGIIGNVGTPTAVVALPYALDRKMLFFGAFTGAGLLRSDPPDRYVFNYRASYAEETAAVVNYLVKVKRLFPEQIAVFAQQDSYGDAGFAGVEKAVRSLRGANDSPILRLGYQRNTVDVDDAVAQLQQVQQQKNRLPIKAVIMVPTYRAAAKFIEKTRDLYPDMIYTSVSFVGSTALANELMLLGKKYATGVIVTQVVPALEGHSSLVLDYKSALAKYFPGEAPDYVSLEGYVDATILVAALQQNGAALDTEKLVATLENLRDLDIGLGAPMGFSRSEHQGVHKVWGTQLDADGRYQPIDLQ
jgi:ABC-type branched-subunit amino acid transport system substrate-binding protein